MAGGMNLTRKVSLGDATFIAMIKGLAAGATNLALALDSQYHDAEAFRDFDKLLAIAKRPNVAAKASALPCYTSDS